MSTSFLLLISSRYTGFAMSLTKSPISKRSFTMTTRLMKEPRRFLPLGKGIDREVAGIPKLKGIVFDVDGTLCLPQTYMFSEMRSALGIPKSTDILSHIHSLPPSEQESAQQKIRAIESSAMKTQVPQPGLLELMTYLEDADIPKAICTRNFDAPVNHLLHKFLPGKSFAPIITRDFRPPKPSPAGIMHIAKSWGFVNGSGSDGDASQLLMVGDSIDDLTAGFTAGAATVLLVNEINAHLATHEHCDLVIRRLDELIEVLEKGFEGRVPGDEERGDTKGRAEEALNSGKGES